VFAADEIAEKEFLPSFRGYNRGEVRAFLRSVAADHRRLTQRRADSELTSLVRQVLVLQRRALGRMGHGSKKAPEAAKLIAMQEELVKAQRVTARQIEEAVKVLAQVVDELRPERAGNDVEVVIDLDNDAVKWEPGSVGGPEEVARNKRPMHLAR
jgi:DivIVA domain-containing protein